MGDRPTTVAAGATMGGHRGGQANGKVKAAVNTVPCACLGGMDDADTDGAVAALSPDHLAGGGGERAPGRKGNIGVWWSSDQRKWSNKRKLQNNDRTEMQHGTRTAMHV